MFSARIKSQQVVYFLVILFKETVVQDFTAEGKKYTDINVYDLLDGPTICTMSVG